VKDFGKFMRENVELLKIDPSFVSRYLNEGFSGGEKKRAEILQMAVLKPEIAILDETDSGLDIDSIRFVAEAINEMRGPDLGVLIITHYSRILEFIKPDFVHVLVNGQIVQSGGPEVATQLEKSGYSEWGEPEPAIAGEEVS
jgi:Fe-S cluster assembly ATP-binding protein